MSPSISGGGGGFANPMTTAGDIIIENATPAVARLAVGSGTQVLGVSAGLPAWVAQAAGGVTQLDYVEMTSNFTVSATVEASATVAIQGAGIALDGATLIKVECFFPIINGGADVLVNLWDGATNLGRILDNANGSVTQYGARFLTPSNATHTYAIKSWRTAGSGTLFGGAGGAGNYMPAWYRVTKGA